MTDFTQYANSPALWFLAAAVFAVIIVQAVLFYRFAREVSASEAIPRSELVVAMRAGAISAIGPSLAVAIVAIGLIPVFGTPAVLMRIGMVGSVPYELAAANAASGALGVELGGEGYDGVAFATVFFTMAVGAAVWMLSVLIGTKSMGTLSAKVQAWNPWVMQTVPGAALIAAFSYLVLNSAKANLLNIAVIVVSGLVMALLLVVAERKQLARLREWALGIAMLAGLFVAAVAA
ncbi:DUF5058 family protein [Leucobacter sp. M11]|uniref:DUF5058 family protein n=1 Tax=Leucobacter sp. M11 TaxID=2993565 RepID=UPI002D7E3853|nr:DUF5058 family protein [Leucobacter sp. M11]MEB4615865.1 DUF5058 family protein [Leucobacter sp. M11]